MNAPVLNDLRFAKIEFLYQGENDEYVSIGDGLLMMLLDVKALWLLPIGSRCLHLLVTPR